MARTIVLTNHRLSAIPARVDGVDTTVPASSTVTATSIALPPGVAASALQTKGSFGPGSTLAVVHVYEAPEAAEARHEAAEGRLEKFHSARSSAAKGVPRANSASIALYASLGVLGALLLAVAVWYAVDATRARARKQRARIPMPRG